MKISSIFYLIVFALVVSTPNVAKAACPGDTQMEMNECAAVEYKKVDKRLNEVYAKIPKSPELLAAQRAWIAFRDAECKFETSSVSGGSMAPLVYASCLQVLTSDRIKQLEQSNE